MKLYMSPGACSLSPHIVLREAGIPFEMETVDLKTKKTASGADFTTINSKGYVPALVLDDGQILTEVPAIVQYLGDQRPESKLVPVAGSMERYRLQEWLTFIGTELHKQYAPLFHGASDDLKQAARDTITQRFGWIANQLAGKPYLMGEHFTAADAYLFTMLTWTKTTKIDLTLWPVLLAYAERVRARPKVAEALAAESALRKKLKQ